MNGEVCMLEVIFSIPRKPAICSESNKKLTAPPPHRAGPHHTFFGLLHPRVAVGFFHAATPLLKRFSRAPRGVQLLELHNPLN